MSNKRKNCLHSTLGLDTVQLKLAKSFTFKDDTSQQPGRKTIPLEACHSQVHAEHYVKQDETRVRRDQN